MWRDKYSNQFTLMCNTYTLKTTNIVDLRKYPEWAPQGLF
jgi:hypothetical protein